MIRRIIGNDPDTLRHIGALFDKGELDAVAFTPFGLWEQAYSWPPTAERSAEGIQACQAMLGSAASGLNTSSVLVQRADEVKRILMEQSAAAEARAGSQPAAP